MMMMMRDGENRAHAERSYDVFFRGPFGSSKRVAQREDEKAEFERN